MPKKSKRWIRLEVLGRAGITTPLMTLEPTAEIVFAAALYLILERSQSISRREMQALLWPTLSTRIASHRLRQTLLKLRQVGVPIALADKSNFLLSADAVEVDYESFLSAPTNSERKTNTSLVLLPAYEPRFSGTYLEWLDSKKTEINASLTRCMLGIIAAHRIKGEWPDAERNAARLLSFQPYNEEATLAMAEACAMRGGKIEAIRILDRYLDEIGRGPSDLRLPATVMRRRIADRMHPRVDITVAESPLVGRGAVMKQLGELLERCRKRKGQACLVWGDAGVGKSRLLSEFSTFASFQGVSTQRVQCSPSDPHRPLSVFVDLVPRLRGMRGAIGCSPETIGYLNRLTKHNPAKLEVKADEGDTEFVYAKTQQSLFDLIDAVSDEGCLIILVEDIHWIDATSAQVLRDMIAWASCHSIMFAFTGRDQPPAWLTDARTVATEMHLLPLEPGPSRDVILGVVRQYGRDIDDNYLDWCVKVAEGNPYFLQELANQWIETGEKQTVPRSLTAVLNARISRLSPDALQLLQTCAVLEKNSSLERLEKVLGYEPHRMLGAINQLGGAGMLIVETTEATRNGDDRVASRHDLLSNAALACLSSPARAFLHRRVGAVLEKEINKERSAAILWDCAKHWQLAGNIRRAFELASSCAAHLMDVGLPGAAAEAYEKSLAYCSTATEQLEMLKGLAHAYYRSSSWENVNKTVVKARRLMKTLFPEISVHDELELMDIRADWSKPHIEVALQRALQCLAAKEATPNHRVQAGGTALMLADLMCDQETMRAIFTDISTLCDTEPVERSSRLRAEMVYHCVCGNLETAVESARLLVKEQRLSGNIGDLFYALCNASATFRTAGLFTDAEAALTEALDNAERHRLKLALPVALEMLTNLALELGETEKAKRWFRELKARHSTIEDQNEALKFRGLAARMALLDRRYAEAKRLSPENLESVYRDPVTHRQTYQLALFVAARLRSSGIEFQRAVEALEKTHIRSRVSVRQAFPTYVLYRGLVRVGKTRLAERLLTEYLNTYRREPWPPGTHILEGLPESRQLARAGVAATRRRS